MKLSLKLSLRRAVDDVDMSLAALGAILAILLTVYLDVVMRSSIYTAVGVTLFLACVSYLLLRRKRPVFIGAQVEATPRIYLLTNILFFALLTYSIAAFHLRPDLYVRPLGYFVATSAMAAILAVEILFLPPRKSATCVALLKIIIVGLSLVWSQLLIYPSLVGVDPWWHQMLTMKILEVGHIPPGYHQYSDLPAMHLVVGTTSLITGLDYKMAAMFSVSLFQVVCGTLFVFLLGKLIHGTKAGLLSGLLLGTGNWAIWSGYWTIPNSMGVVLIPVIIYLLFKLRQEKPKLGIGLSVLFIIVLALTHTISTVMLVTVLFVIWLAFELYRVLRYQAAERAWVFLVAALGLMGGALSYWARTPFIWRNLSRLSSQFKALLVQGFSPRPGDLSPLEAAVLHYRGELVPFGERLLNVLGFLLFCALALIGAFSLLSRSTGNRHGFAVVVAGLTALVIAFAGTATDFFALARWTNLSQVLLAIPVGMAILWLAGLPAEKIASACLIGTLVFALSFLMVMSPEANQDNRSLSPNTIVRFAFTESELAAMNRAAMIYDGKIAGDKNYESLQYLPGLRGRTVAICNQLYSRNFTECRDMFVLIRQEVVVNPLKMLRLSPFRLDYDPRQALAEQGFSRVYECGSVSGFIK